ncbi:MAG: hypothetical protein ACTSRU_10610 [Candidatus Hodarchaeales archaeon]
MAKQVTYQNLFSESRENVVALMTSKNVPHPTLSAAEAHKWIYSRDPDVKSSGFKGYPFLVVHPVDVDIEKEKGSVDMKSKFVFWDIEVEIATSERGYGEADGKGLSHMDAISNNLLKTFLDKTNRITLSNNSMKFGNVTTTAVGTEVTANELTYRRSIMLSFKSRIQVSA